MKAEKRVATEEDLRQAGIKGSTTPSAKRVPSHSSLEEGSLSCGGGSDIFANSRTWRCRLGKLSLTPLGKTALL